MPKAVRKNRKTIDTLIEDVNELLVNGSDDIPDEMFDEVGKRFAGLLKSRLSLREKRQATRLRMSNIGSPCFRKTYLQIKFPEEQPKMSPEAYLKFLYGDLIEEMMLFLAEASGHQVTGRQDTYEIAGIEGHKDASVDGVLLDVKSTSSYSYKKFAEHRLLEDDPFGYHVQLQSYLDAAQDDPMVTEKGKAAFWAIDKTLGKHCLDFYEKKDWDFEKGYQIRIDQLGQDALPDRSFEPEPHQKSGNMQLPTFCSYCDMKYKCYEGENLRTFLASTGPLYLTEVKREPKMVEIDKDGNKVETI